MKKVFLALPFLLLAFTSCEEEDKCKECSATVVSKLDGQVVGTVNIDGQTVCDDELEQIEMNPEVTTEVESGGIKQTTVTTYTCK